MGNFNHGLKYEYKIINFWQGQIIFLILPGRKKYYNTSQLPFVLWEHVNVKRFQISLLSIVTFLTTYYRRPSCKKKKDCPTGKISPDLFPLLLCVNKKINLWFICSERLHAPHLPCSVHVFPHITTLNYLNTTKLEERIANLGSSDTAAKLSSSTVCFFEW